MRDRGSPVRRLAVAAPLAKQACLSLTDKSVSVNDGRQRPRRRSAATAPPAADLHDARAPSGARDELDTTTKEHDMSKRQPHDEVSIEIEATPEDVYALVSDITRMGEWSPECRRCTWTKGASGPAVGARFRARNKGGRGPSW